MRTTVPQRLNDIIDYSAEPIVDLEFPVLDILPDTPAIKRLMYEAVVDNYGWAIINFDNEEQFKHWFGVYWRREVPVYYPLFRQFLMMSQNLEKARVEVYHGEKTDTTTPNLQTETTYALGDTVALTHGRTLTEERNLTEESSNTQYEQQVIDGDRTLGGTQTNTYGGTDTTVRSGQNTDTRVETGNSVVAMQHDTNNTVTIYDVEKLKTLINETSVLNDFIDKFSPLFNEVIFFM